jgi:hypothetical protein
MCPREPRLIRTAAEGKPLSPTEQIHRPGFCSSRFSGELPGENAHIDLFRLSMSCLYRSSTCLVRFESTHHIQRADNRYSTVQYSTGRSYAVLLCVTRCYQLLRFRNEALLNDNKMLHF